METRFFTRLRELIRDQAGRAHPRHVLNLKVQYPSGHAVTYGGTKAP